MKNLKRALSLVLSTAMLVGMMVVGTGAASFTDVAESDHKEAIEVMNMVGIMKGVSETEFAPEKIVTRNEMAVVMCNLLDLKLNGAHPFTDVATWADDYVAAIYTNGYTAGKSATTFGGSDKITTAEAALMIMKTLGYFEFQGEFGDDWKLATVKKATELKLFDDIDAGINNYLNRGEVAQMVLNALDDEVKIAKEIGGMTVEGNGITVTEKPTYSYSPIWDEDLNRYQSLADKLFDGDLYKTTDGDIVNNQAVVVEDAFGRPAVKWTYVDGIENPSVTIADEPTLVFTAEQSLKAMTKALKDYTLAEIVAVEDGQNGATVNPTVEAYKAVTQNGDRVEIFTDKAMNVTDIVVINEYVGKIVLVNKADEVSGAERSVKLAGIAAYETEEFAKNDYVLYTKAYNADTQAWEVQSMELAESVEGKVTAKVAGSYLKIDGVTYKMQHNFSTSVAVGDTVLLYVDSNGYLVNGKVTKSAASVEDYVLTTSAVTQDQWDTNMIKVLYADGTKATLTIDAAEGNTIPSIGTLYTIEKTDDGYKFTEAADAEDVDADGKYAGYDSFLGTEYDAEDYNKDKGTVAGMNVADDAVIFVDKGSNKYTVITGAQLKKTASITEVNNAYAMTGDDGFDTIELAYVTSALSGTGDVLYGYVTKDIEDVKNADDVTVQSITIWDGAAESTYLAPANGNVNGATKGDFISFKINADGEIVNVNATDVPTTKAVLAVNGTSIQFVGDSARYDLDDDTIYIYVDDEACIGAAEMDVLLADKTYDNEGNHTGYTDNVKAYVDNDGDVVVLFVEVNNKIIDPAE